MEDTQYYIGLMSGTSLDGIDAALVEISTSNPRPILLASHIVPLSSKLKNKLTKLSLEPSVNIIELGQTAAELAYLYADVVAQLLQLSQLNKEQITAIGCHGITVRHAPEGEFGFSMQLIDANRLTQLCGIDVISDLRGMDIAVSGQGAPLVPAFHQALLSRYAQEIVVLNLGGIANISVIEQDQPLLGFDTGPANTLINQWIERHTAKPYDEKGAWGQTGTLNTQLLNLLLEEPYFLKPLPKSTGKELFNLNWLDSKLDEYAQRYCGETVSIQDVQTTLTHLTAKSVAMQIEKFNLNKVAVCGGGVENDYLMALLKSYLPNKDVFSIADMGVNPDALEAMAFAWFAYCRVNQIPGNTPSVTGATKSVVLGAWYSAGR